MGRTQTIQAQDGELWGYSDPRNPDGLIKNLAAKNAQVAKGAKS